MLVRLINWIGVLTFLIGCAAPFMPAATTEPTPTPAATPRPIVSLAPTMAATPVNVVEDQADKYLLAFASERDNLPGIYVTDLRGRSVQLITRQPMQADHPAWSPDGKRIAFTARQGAQHELFVVDVDGANLVQLTRDQGDNFYPTWSPDSQRLAFATNRDGFNQIYAMHADGSQVQRLTDTMVREEKPAWSPDGRQIAFYSNRDGNAEVYVIEPDGTRMQRVTYQAEWDGQPAWSPVPIAIPTFPCPATKPNGSQPPGETTISTEYHSNGALWTVLPADGILHVRRESDGRISTKLPWWRGVSGMLTIAGRRLDGDGKFSAHIPDGYGNSGFQATGVYFSSEGCWEVQGHVGAAELKFVVDVKVDE